MHRSMKWRIGLILICWLSMIGFDFFLHAGFLAKLYNRPSSFLLPAEEAFRRIPLGYLSFLVLAFILVWITERLEIKNWQNGFWLGLKLGAILWGSFAVGLYSISTVKIDLLFGWWIGQTLELGITGIVVGAAMSGKRLKILILWVLLFVALLIIATIVLQAVGFAPPMKRVGG